LLAALEFRSNNERHRPVMQALELVKRFADTKLRTFPAEEKVPLDGVVRGLWRDAVVEKDAVGQDRVNRVTYEVAVLGLTVHSAQKVMGWTLPPLHLVETARRSSLPRMSLEEEMSDEQQANDWD